MSPKLQEELLKEMARLSQEEQQRVIRLCEEPSCRAHREGQGRTWRDSPERLIQMISSKMAAVIEEGCERINKSEW